MSIHRAPGGLCIGHGTYVCTVLHGWNGQAITATVRLVRMVNIFQFNYYQREEVAVRDTMTTPH